MQCPGATLSSSISPPPHVVFCLAVGALLAVLFILPPAQAQTRSERPPTQQSPDASSNVDPPGTSVPSYAEPSTPSSPDRSPEAAQTQQSDPGTPSDPAQAPIGGLGWLAAGAAGYGAYRLRKDAVDEGKDTP